MTFDWTPAEWDNLQRLSNTLQRLLAEPVIHRQNGAWQAMLRITLKNLAGYTEPSKFD